MAVVSIKETWQGRTNGVDEALRRTYKRIFRIRCSAMTDGPVQVRLTSGLPARLDPYVSVVSGEFDLAAACKNIEVHQDDDDPFTWWATADYDTSFEGVRFDPAELPAPPSGQGEQTGDVTEQITGHPPTYEWDTEVYQRPAHRQASTALSVNYIIGPNAPIQNSAKQQFDPLPEMDDCRFSLTITRRQLAFDDLIVSDYTNKVNNDDFRGWGPGLVKCHRISARSQYEHRTFHYEVVYVFHFRKEGWTLKIPDFGTRQFNTAGDDFVNIIDAHDGTVVTKPVPLDGSGHKLGANEDPVNLTFEVYETTNFAPLGLG